VRSSKYGRYFEQGNADDHMMEQVWAFFLCNLFSFEARNVSGSSTRIFCSQYLHDSQAILVRLASDASGRRMRG